MKNQKRDVIMKKQTSQISEMIERFGLIWLFILIYDKFRFLKEIGEFRITG